MDGDPLTRRAVLAATAAAGVGSLAGCSALEGGENAPTTALEEAAARDLAVRFAPELQFDAVERWFPTDPRPYESDRDGERVVDGFDALDGYVRRTRELGAPPDPTVFYRALRYEGSSLGAVQFWLYSAFDQFTTNFHWHDWEVLHAFVDLDSREPQLYVASSHSRNVPNNEFLDPDPEVVPRVLSELGSHSSALSVNDDPESFQRLPTGETFADVTNGAVQGIERLAELPAAYGLPRDEGARLPYLVPELDNAPLYEHERLPAVQRADLLPPALTVRSFDALAAPPADLPGRSAGPTFQHVDRGGGDVTYELAPTADLEDIAAFTGPQLSFEFAVPEFAEDAVAGHITTAGTPWSQPRYDDPVADITDPRHRATLSDRYDAVAPPGPVNSVVAAVSEAVASDDAPEGAGLTTEPSPVESVALLSSDPTAVPTFRGVALLRDVPAGEHRLTVNGAGLAPHSESLSVAESEPAVGGVDGEIPLVANENAVKLEVDPRGVEADLTRLAVADDFAGRLYDAPLAGPDAVYVHRGGAYTTEVRDAEDAVGAFRVSPDDTGVRIERPRTGKASLATYLATLAEETSADVRAVADGSGDRTARSTDTAGGADPVRGLARALSAVAEAASRAAERAEAGDRTGADRRLQTVAERLDRVASRLSAARGDLPAPLARAVDRRLDQARRRSEQARAAEKL